MTGVNFVNSSSGRQIDYRGLHSLNYLRKRIWRMVTEKEKMLAGLHYNAGDPELTEARTRCRRVLKQFNESSPQEHELRSLLLRELIPLHGEGLWIEAPFFCDYGQNIWVGEKVYFNFNCTILDVMQVKIGDQVLFGPGVQIYTAMHPMDWEERASGLEFAKPVEIGSYVWVGGGAIICPGVTIGSRTVIGAGSVVTRDLPDSVFAAGNPCRIIKKL